MNNGKIQNMQYKQSPTSGFSNFHQSSPQHPQLQGWGAPTQGWGTPAMGYSPNQRGGRTQGQYTSPGSQQYSPRHNSFNTPSSQNFSPRNNSYNSQKRYHSPNDANKFRTPHSPFSPPSSYGSSRGRGNGRKSFINQFGQTPRRDRNCNPGGSSKIEDYYHPSMLDDPWKFCPPVPATSASMAAT